MNIEVIAFVTETLLHFERKHPFPADLEVSIANFPQGVLDSIHNRLSVIHYFLSIIDGQRAKLLLSWPCSNDVGYVNFARDVCTYIVEFNRGSTTIKISQIGRPELLSPSAKQLGFFLMNLATVSLKCCVGEAFVPSKPGLYDFTKRFAILEQKLDLYKSYAELERIEESPAQFDKMEKLKNLRELHVLLHEKMTKLLSMTPVPVTSTDDVSALSEAVAIWASKATAPDDKIEAKLDAIDKANAALNELATLCRSLKAPVKIEKSKLTLNTAVSNDSMEMSKISLPNSDGQRSLSTFYAASFKNIAEITNGIVRSTNMGSISSLNGVAKTLADLVRRLSELRTEEILKKKKNELAVLTSTYDALPKIPLVYTYERPGIEVKFPEIKKEDHLDSSPGDSWAVELDEELRTGLPFGSNGRPNSAVPLQSTPAKNRRSSARSTIFSRRATRNSIWQLPLSSSSPMSRMVNEAADDASESNGFDVVVGHECSLDVSADFCAQPKTDDSVLQKGFEHLECSIPTVPSEVANDPETQPCSVAQPTSARRSIDDLISRYKNLRSRIHNEN